ncbi:MAG: hypothetical protein KF862_03880 [Chitinophagaceae bacterium]|nr:hypothetical protein [Chitinophagaceae bacterium]
MKKIIPLLYIKFFFGVCVFAQPTNVYTCKGSAVSAIIQFEGTTDQKNAWRQAFLNWGASENITLKQRFQAAPQAYALAHELFL